MTVAVKNVPETGAAGVLDHLAIASLAGVAYVAATLWAIFYGIPSLWWNVFGLAQGWTNAVIMPGASAFSVVLLLLAMLGATVLLWWGGARLYQAHARPGLRAGIFFGFVGLILVAEITSGVGIMLQHYASVSAGVGIGITGVVGVALLAGLGFLCSRPGFEGWLVVVEEQGWFSTASYKRNQGARVRRATLLAVLLVIGCGVYTLLAHQTLQTGGSWLIRIPYTDLAIPVLPHVQFTVPLLLTALALWLGWRMVDYPVFADFLIATEAEINKVSWTTRKRLIQDTVVVLVTVALLTVFLFVVDMAWAWSLSQIGVIQQAPAGSQVATPQEPSF